MRFCYPFTLGTSSRDGKQTLASHQRIGAQSGVQCDQPLSNFFSPPTTFIGQIARSTRRPRNLTEFPFERSFVKLGFLKLGLERL